MSIARTQYLEPVILPAGRIRAGLAAAIGAGGGPSDLKIDLVRILPDGSHDERADLPLASLDAVCDLGEEGLQVRAGWNQDGEFHYLGLYGGTRNAGLHVSSPSAGLTQALIDAFMRGADVSLWSPPPPSGEPTPEMPPELIEAGAPSGDTEPGRVLAPPRLRAFLSYRFGLAAHELDASRVQRLLAILRVDTVTGTSYEPRRLSDKVRDRLVGIDLLIQIIHADGESMWTRDEVTVAHSAGVYLAPVVEQGADFAAGILGDIEYITFGPGHIGDAFLSIAEAVEYVRRVQYGGAVG